MSNLVIMRQRIKAIETIKKVTNAMQLISMSTHTKVKHIKTKIHEYQTAINTLFHVLNSEERPADKKTSSQHLAIIIGSQKGLCGTFNHVLFRFFLKNNHIQPSTHLIIVGKVAYDYFSYQGVNPYRFYHNLTLKEFVSIAHNLTDLILSAKESFDQVTIYSMEQKSFFFQKPRIIQLLPFQSIQQDQVSIRSIEYLYEEDPQNIISYTKKLMIQTTLLDALAESLLAEQAARFVSMDSATRNAQDLLNTMKLQYNKTRQTQITSELTDLAAGILS